jgi:hypothetical protein
MKVLDSKFNFNELVERWPSPLVARAEVARFSGGVLNARTLANLDSSGRGPERLRIGSRVAYPAKALADWMRARAHEGNAVPKNGDAS